MSDYANTPTIELNVPFVETDVPIPSMLRGRAPAYPISILKPGESFLAHGEVEIVRQRINSAVYYAKKSNPSHTYTTRTQHNPPGVRVWRVV